MTTFVVTCTMKFTKPSCSWWSSDAIWSGIYLRLRKAETKEDAEALALHSVRSEISNKHTDVTSITLEQVMSVELESFLKIEDK